MYNAIKSQQILQPVSSSMGRSSMSSLSPGGGGVMRNRSLRANQQDRLTTLKRGSIRGLQSILSAQAGASPYSSNSSIDGRVSPSPSFATSQDEVRMRMFLEQSRFSDLVLGHVWLEFILPQPYPWLCLESLAYYHQRGPRRRRPKYPKW